MANPGVGTKFVSVNLNKSYGKQSNHHHHHTSSHSISYGSNRTRPSSHGSGGGGMVVLSRPRSSQKTGTKLSVPPPLNLPSLRKEHERSDSSGSGGGSSGNGISGSGSRPSSSGMGWTKPGTVALREKEGLVDSVDQGLNVVDFSGKSSSGVYMPPSRSSIVGPLSSAPVHAFLPADKVTVFRGEDFPSLKAALPVVSVPVNKQKEGLNQKQKQVPLEESSDEQRNSFHMSMDVHSQLLSGRGGMSNGLNNNGESHGFGGPRTSEQARKQEEYFPGPLPLVRLNPRSDWADDERDTGHGLTDRGRDHGFTKSEPFWERDFDMPRVSILPQKPVNNLLDRRGQRDNEIGKVSSCEVNKVETYGRDVLTPSREGREGTSWRASSPISRNGVSAFSDRNGIVMRPSGSSTEIIKENKYIPSPFRDNSQNHFVKRDMGHGLGGRQASNSSDSFGSRGAERSTRDRYGSEQYNRHRSDSFQNSVMSKSSFSLGGKGLPLNDPILNFGREKRSLSKNEKPYLEDPFMKDFGSTSFDGRDPFSGGLVGVVKRKKDVLKQTDFHDPVRESFEAELERVQKMQEQERQRVIEEQERALELARREEEERLRLAQEQEEQQRRLEEEAREAAWRAEQEQLEALRRAEEQRTAREEEKQRIFMEEERRKQAARQKLLELEEKIAKRQTEVGKGGSNSPDLAKDKLSGMGNEREISQVAEAGDWEESERMAEKIATSASLDASSLIRPFDMNSRSHYSRDASAFLDRGKPSNSWRRDVFENGNSSAFISQEPANGHHSPRRDASAGGRVFPRKEYFGGAGFMSSRSYYKPGIPDPHMDDFSHPKGQRWNVSGYEDLYSRNTDMESEFHENLPEKYGDAGWGRSRGNAYFPCPERVYQSSETDGFYSFGRSRYSMRQPRVLPPPSFASVQRTSYRGEYEGSGSSAFLENGRQDNRASRNESALQTGYNSGRQDNIDQSGTLNVQQESAENAEQKMKRSATQRCDSQSSLSVSSPPDSPVQLSHDDLDESGGSPVSSATEEGRHVASSGRENKSVVLRVGRGTENMTASGSATTGDDEEWTIENNEQLQEQEEYDEDEDGYQEEDEVLEGDALNVDLSRELEYLHLEERGSPHMMDNLVLGFNEGVEVGMPNDELERSSKNENNTFAMPYITIGSGEEQGSFDGLYSDAQTLEPVESENANKMAMQELVLQPNNAPQKSMGSELMDHAAASGSSGISAQCPVSSLVEVDSLHSSGQTVISTVPSVPSQAEAPVKLQFGLFSGPSLIPSPVPAIQIGSIQMPLHLHPQIGPSLSHMHPSQPPLVQFGQLRYASPISQGVLPLAPQSMSFVQPGVPANFTLNQNPRGPMHIQPGKETSSQNPMKDDVLSHSVDNRAGTVSRHSGIMSKDLTSVPATEHTESTVLLQKGCGKASHLDVNDVPIPNFQAQDQGHHSSVAKNYKSLSTVVSGGHSQSASKEKDLSGSNSQGLASGGRGKKYVFTVKNSGSRTSLVPEVSRSDSSGFQRRYRRSQTEFKVRENSDKGQPFGSVYTDQNGLEEKSNFSGKGIGVTPRSSSRKVTVSNKLSKQTFESECSSAGPLKLREADYGSRDEKRAGKDYLSKSQNIPYAGDGNLKRNIHSEDDVDTPLQSGVVRVFEQPGIEAPSDEDDFIEVRSKRQMLNDRREQREKEIKAKSRVTKIPRKPRSAPQNNMVSASSNKISSSRNAEAANSMRSDFVAAQGHVLANHEVSSGFNAVAVSQPLAPIGTPAVKADAQSDTRPQPIKSIQGSSLPVVSGAGKSLTPSLMFESQNKVLDNVHASLGSWSNSRISQQVMALTQTQLDEAMKPVQFDAHTSAGTTSVTEPSISSSILTKDKSFSSAASPINSLLAGEKIQFGAVTSPTILPPSSRAITHGIGPPGPSRSDKQMSHHLSAVDNDCSLFFEKEKHSDESCSQLEDREAEAEAEAAASAVAVAAISNDETVGSGLGTCSVSVSDSKSFGGADIDGISPGTKKWLPPLVASLSGVSGEQQLVNQSRAEESLTVALPADLSVDTPPISLWPPLPSPQSSSSQMLSHFPGGPHSHFPFYEMNPILGGPIFAFGPHEDSSSTQSQPQKSSVSVSSPLGSWQQCHSGVDSFYGPPAGFTGPFISAPGGMPGVQGPPHMVVYNHFAPVGQFGQVGLSFMGTYIPSGKQPDWKHNPVSSAMGVGDGEMNNLSMVSAQRSPANMSAPIQHLAPGSPLLPVPSPLALFDVSPFQSSPEMPVQARWSNVPPSLLQNVPLSMPLQQQVEGGIPPPFNHGSAVDQSLNNSRFPESRTSTPSDTARKFPAATDPTPTQLPNKLGLVEPPSSTSAGASVQKSVVGRSSSTSTVLDAGKTRTVQNGTGNNGGAQNTTSSFKSQTHQRNTSAQHYGISSGYNYQRGGGASQKNNSGGEWSNRRMGFHGRNQSLGAEKNFPASKMKQIYVAKQTTSGTSTSS